MLRLRPSRLSDIDLFYRLQQDREAVRMAAFTSANLSDRTAFEARWRRVLADDAVLVRTIVLPQDTGAEEAVGQVICAASGGRPEVSFWVARQHWGQGYATAALRLLLGEVPQRPVFARVAWDNSRSLKVLQHNGFHVVGSDINLAAGRDELVRECVLRLAS